MIRVSVCYSNKQGSEFASCGLSDIEIDHAMLDNPTALRDKIAASYQVCEAMVNAQLGTPATPPLAVNPAVARVNQPPPAPVVMPAPLSTPPAVSSPQNGRTFYDGRGQNGHPTTGRQLRQWATKNGSLAFFEDFASKQQPALPRYFGDWPDAWAVHAHATWLAACIPPAVAATNGVAPH
jgi:hypothetical protein